MVEHNFLILSRFFEQVLVVDKDTAMGDACKMEHLLSNETGKRMLWLMRYLLSEEELAVKVRERMSTYKPRCDPLTEQCPVCGGTTECLATAEAAH